MGDDTVLSSTAVDPKQSPLTVAVIVPVDGACVAGVSGDSGPISLYLFELIVINISIFYR